ncbi:LysR family transcriptional regulator [Acuticoccus sediminis]|uniref:LysR family transcriptional regulator n=1 Tax=Acuticoccus sediminis TaxID=2184697 RepID=UPI001CFF39E5|nr:LysR family transcriptional regulator [Acuticoccus sediminis]
MEMHQVRYFLAVARLLNFTRAADECNVSQPSLTRAIKLLEHELGGDLLRRERGLTHLTELGERMLPLLARCYESAASAKAVAAAMKSRNVAALRLGLSDAVDITPFLPALMELLRAFAGLSLKIDRGTSAATAEALREGRTDLALSCPAAMTWDRYESWPLFEEGLHLAFPAHHRFSARNALTPEDLAGERLIVRRHCETAPAVEEILAGHGIDLSFGLEANSERDVIELVATGGGVAIVPTSTALPSSMRTAAIQGLSVGRQVKVYAVRGRHRSPAAAMLLTQLRAADWAPYEWGSPCDGPASASSASVNA